MIKNFKKYLLILAGTISLVLGIAGIIIPILPTTPFLLLTSFCYLKSSKRLYRWLITRKTIGTYIYNYVTYKAVLKSTKIASLIVLWATLGISIMLVDFWHVRLLLVVVGIGVSIHLLTLKTIAKKDISKQINKELDQAEK